MRNSAKRTTRRVLIAALFGAVMTVARPNTVSACAPPSGAIDDPEAVVLAGAFAKSIDGLGAADKASVVLKNLEKYDTIYESGFSASGTLRHRDIIDYQSGSHIDVKRRWKVTCNNDRFGSTEDVIDHEKTLGQKWIRTKRFGYWGQDLSGHYFEDTLFDVSPDGKETGKSKWLHTAVHGPRDTSSDPSKCDFLWALGRMFSKQLDEVTRAEKSEEGLLVVSARGKKFSQQGRWELEIEPGAAWLVRKARFYSNARPESITTEMVNSGTVRSGPYCIPVEAKINCFNPIGRVETKHLTFDPVVRKFDEKLYSTVRQAVGYNKEPSLEVYDYRVSPHSVTQPNRPKPEDAPEPPVTKKEGAKLQPNKEASGVRA